jgi:Ca-activated chloride channel family protein
MSGGFQFAQPGAALWIWLVAALAVVLVMGLQRRRQRLAAIAESGLMARLSPNLDLARAWIRAGLVLAASLALVAAIMDPRWGMQVEQVQRRGLDVIFAIDVSRSMLAGDASPSRLERARQFALDASEALEGDRVGLVDFAGVAAIRTPLTLNYAAFRQAVRDLEPKASARGGSMLGEAIRMAANSFPAADKGAKVIVVLSDGEDMESDPVTAAANAREEQGVRVFTVGIGDSRDGARIPVMGADGQRRFLVHEGQEIWSRMSPDTLEQVAAAGGGAFIAAGTSQVDMAAVYRTALADLDRIDQESSLVKRQTPRFQWFAGAALLLLVMESLITDRKVRKVGVA